MESTTSKQNSGGKSPGESTGMPKQNSRANLNDKSPRKNQARFGTGGGESGAVNCGYTKESI